MKVRLITDEELTGMTRIDVINKAKSGRLTTPHHLVALVFGEEVGEYCRIKAAEFVERQRAASAASNRGRIKRIRMPRTARVLVP